MILAGEIITFLGVLGMLVAALGMLRMPDFFTRLHPAGIKDSFGLPLVVLGLAMQAGLTLASAKLWLLLLFTLFTSPVACHALARAALVIREKKSLRQQEKQP
jgi:multicomponent Na+:H+ antiporter subunit G